MLRIGAIAIAVLPPLLGVLLHGSSWGAGIGAGIGPGLAIVGGVAFTLVRPRVRALALLGTMLAVLAGLAASHLLPPAGLEVDEHPTPVWLRGLLVILATLGSLVCLWIAAKGHEQPSAGDPRRRRANKGTTSLLLLLLLHGAGNDQTTAERSVVTDRLARSSWRTAPGLGTVHGGDR